MMLNQTGVAYWPFGFEGPQPAKLRLDGVNNYGKPRQAFADRLANANPVEYLQLAEMYIWLSAYADNNPTSDYHWKADACFDEAVRRCDVELYQLAHNRASSHNG
jgi:hypothetical protein